MAACSGADGISLMAELNSNAITVKNINRPVSATASSLSAEGKTSKKVKGQKRFRNPAEWQREKRKRLRIAGKAYVNVKGELVKEKELGSDCGCHRNCYVKVSEDIRLDIFNSYYSLHDHNEQNAYLYSLIRKQPVLNRRADRSNIKTRRSTFHYHVRICGTEVQVCRQAFANIHGITFNKIRVLCQKLDKNVLFPRDERGRHANHKKVASELVEQVRGHIKSILKSDRLREFWKDDRGNGPDLNITKMWRDFLEKKDPNYGRYQITKKGKVLDLPKNREESDFTIGDSMETLGIHFVSDLMLNRVNAEKGSDLELNRVDGESSFQMGANENNENTRTPRKLKVEPLVKHWLYTKILHEEVRPQDYFSLHRRIVTDSESSSSSAEQQKPGKRKRVHKPTSGEKEYPETSKEGRDGSRDDVSQQSVISVSTMPVQSCVTNAVIPDGGVIVPAMIQGIGQVNLLLMGNGHAQIWGVTQPTQDVPNNDNTDTGIIPQPPPIAVHLQQSSMPQLETQNQEYSLQYFHT